MVVQAMQFVVYKNMTPSPYITCVLDSGKKVLFDVDGQSKETIIERLNKTLGKSEEMLKEEALEAEKKDNPANFGMECSKYCMCTFPGQVPCPGYIPLPKQWRGKYALGHAEDNE